MGVEVVLEKATLTEEQYSKNPLNANRLWLNGSAFEMYLPESSVGEGQDEESGAVYRTVSFAGASFKDVPANMIIHAGLIAAGNSVRENMADIDAVGLVSTKGNSCCDTKGASCCEGGGSSCCTSDKPEATPVKKKSNSR